MRNMSVINECINVEIDKFNLNYMDPLGVF